MKEKHWLSSYPTEVSPTLDYPEAALPQFLLDSASRNPKNTATRFMGKMKTYEELLHDTFRAARFLKSLGVEKGDKVSIALPNCPQYVSVYYAVLLLGAVVVQTNPLYTERELIHQFADADVKVSVCLDLIFPKILSIKERTNLSAIVTTSIKDALPFPKNLLYPLTQKIPAIPLEPFVYKWDRVTAFSPEPMEPVSKPDDLAVLQYTGGTTGTPKGVMLTHRNLVSNIMQTRAWIYQNNNEGQRILSAVPFFHVYGMTVSMNLAVSLAGTMILVPRFQPKEILKTIHREKPTLFPGAPTMYVSLLNHPDLEKYDLSSIDACISGSAALPLEVQTKFEELTGGKLVEGYGLSEASPVTHCNPIWEKRINGSIGVPWPDTLMKIVDLETGGEVPLGEKGELLIKGPQVMLGYYNNEEETKKTLKDGWLYTGDVAYQDEEGFTYIVDRKKEMIIASGFNIYPREVEEVLYQHPSVLECAVIGAKDEYRGETVKAFIVFKEGQEASKEELDAYCRDQLASYKVPRIYEFRNELPKSMVGKILKRELK